MTCKVIVACAGSGKTTYLVEESLKEKVPTLMLTYTNANEASIRKKIIEKIGYIPNHITIQTWFSFLLEHCIRPYRSTIVEKHVKGLNFNKIHKNGKISFTKKEDTIQYYFDKEMCVYKDRAADLAVQLDNKTSGAVSSRIGEIFNKILIDEYQDLSGYDYELIKILCFKCNIMLVGDPRQKTYSTNDNPKNKNYSLLEYLKNHHLTMTVDMESLRINHRSVSSICEFASKLYPDYRIESDFSSTDENQGVIYIREEEVESYLIRFPGTIQLRHSNQQECSSVAMVLNYGESKGLEFNRVMIYPTEPIYNWLTDPKTELKDQTRNKFYVALTRARLSVFIVVDKKHLSLINNSKVKTLDYYFET